MMGDWHRYKAGRQEDKRRILDNSRCLPDGLFGGTLFRHNNVLSWIGDIENIHTCGRNGLFRYIFMDRAMEMGFEAAMIVQGRQKL